MSHPARISPAQSARPPKPPIPARRSVPRPPRHGSIAKPPAIARYARQPRRAAITCRVAPGSTPKGRAVTTGTLSTRDSKSPPHSATSAARSNFIPAPRSVISRTGVFSGFPTNRFASRIESGSIAPPAVIPSRRRPGRPRSWIVVSRPASVIVTSIGQTPPD